MIESPDGTIVLPEVITDATGAEWSLIETPQYGGQVFRNYQTDENTRQVIDMLYFNHTIYIQNKWAWYKYAKGWILVPGDPRL